MPKSAHPMRNFVAGMLVFASISAPLHAQSAPPMIRTLDTPALTYADLVDLALPAQDQRRETAGLAHARDAIAVAGMLEAIGRVADVEARGAEVDLDELPIGTHANVFAKVCVRDGIQRAQNLDVMIGMDLRPVDPDRDIEQLGRWREHPRLL